MLYTTTRNQNDVFTAHRAIHTDCAPDGGLYLPFRMPQWDKEQVLSLTNNSFCQNMADVLNSFFATSFSGWDIEFALGRKPARTVAVSRREIIVEAWHNTKKNFDHSVRTISDRLRKEGVGQLPTDWVKIAVSVAFIFAIYGEYLKEDAAGALTPVDIAVATGDFSMPISVWYARQMGLNIGNIICGCNANGGVWDLLHKGEFATGAVAVQTVAPDGDYTVPRDLERLIHGVFGDSGNRIYLEKCATGSVYKLREDEQDALRKGMFAAVISDERIRSLVSSIYRTNAYILGPYGALAYGSLMDYRAKTGESRTALLISERGAACDGEFVAQCLDISIPELQQKLM